MDTDWEASFLMANFHSTTGCYVLWDDLSVCCEYGLFPLVNDKSWLTNSQPGEVWQNNQTENSDEKGWNQERCQSVTKQAGRVENEVKSLESHDKA